MNLRGAMIQPFPAPKSRERLEEGFPAMTLDRCKPFGA